MSASVPPAGRTAYGERVVLWARVTSLPDAAGEHGPQGTRRSRSVPPEVGASFAAVVRGLEARLQAGGGTLEAQLSGQIVASFPAADAIEAIELGLELLDEAHHHGLAVALASSSTWSDANVRLGRAFDDAFLLASRAKSGEILVDGALRERVLGHFLYARQVSAAGLRAASIDRRHPRRSACLAALARLGPPCLAGATAELVAPVADALRAGGFVVLEGPIGAGATELVGAVGEELGGGPALWLGRASGPITVLESLRRRSSEHRFLRPLFERDGMPTLDALVDALVAELDAVEGLTWIVLNPLGALDAASLEAVAALRSERPVAILARAPLDASIPEILGAPTLRLTLPALRIADMRAVVSAIFGPTASDDIVRRVATLAGDTTLGCEEAARLLVASGDLVLDGDVFAWRTTPRTGAGAESVEDLCRERLELLDASRRRALEVVSVAPIDADRDLLAAIAANDGISARELDAALDDLAREGWTRPRDEPTAHFFRRVVQTSMPPARLAELHRFVLDALPRSGPNGLWRAHFAIEGDRAEAARAELERLATWLESSGFSSTRAMIGATGASLGLAERPGRASGSATRLEEAKRVARPAPSSVPPPGLEDDSRGPDPSALREALSRRDLGAAERWVEQATAAGADWAALARVRALIDLARGDVTKAEIRLARAGEAHGPRLLIARSMVSLGAGRTADAVRSALQALSVSLRRSDERGRSAALHALAACYRAEGRPSDADRLASRALG